MEPNDEKEYVSMAFRSFSTETKRPAMEEQSVRYQSTSAGRNSPDKTSFDKVEMKPYEQSPLSICTILVNDDKVDAGLDDKNTRYVWYETELLTKERKRSTQPHNNTHSASAEGQSQDDKAGVQTGTLTLHVEITDSATVDGTRISLPSSTQPPASHLPLCGTQSTTLTTLPSTSTRPAPHHLTSTCQPFMPLAQTRRSWRGI